ncbi:MAG: amidohydrolase [Candidatus Njordarchaeia archaeon]|nr:amidohydrolase [Candidatus Korarchaeota archaeon]
MYVLHPSLVVTMDKNMRILRDVYLGITNGVISEISKEKPKDAEEIVELPGRIIIPGLINAHTHVAMVILRGLKDDVDLMTWLNKYIFPAEACLNADDVYYGSLYGISEMLSSGITTFNEMYYFMEKIAQATIETGVRSVLSLGILDLVSEDRTPEKEIKKAHDFLGNLEKLWNIDKKLKERLFFAYGPHAPYTCSEELLRRVAELAKKKKVRVHIHLSETKSEVQQIKEKTGKTPIQYLESIGFLGENVMAAHVVWPTENDLQILSHYKVNVLHNPISNLKLASGIAPIDKMFSYNINVALGTDGAASNNRLDMFREMHLAALIHKGNNLDPKIVSAREVLKMATINGARALGLENQIGSIEINKFADLVVLNAKKVISAWPKHDIYSRIVYAMDRNAVERVMVDGKWVWVEGKPININIESLRERIQEIRDHIEHEIAT